MAIGDRSGLRPFLIAALSLAALVVIPGDHLPWVRGPAPYPPEWQWGLRAEPATSRLAMALLVPASLLLLLAASGTRWARARPRACAHGLLLAAVVCGLAFPLALLQREPQGSLRALLRRAASPSISSYHTVAVSPEARDVSAFLRTHARLLPELAQGRKHAATHPPGPVLWYRGALAACERWPGLVDLLLTAVGSERHPAQTEQGRAVRSAALLGALGLSLLGALTVWPLARLAEHVGLEPLPAARVAALWALLPGPALMTPALDAAIALPIVLAAALLARAAVSRSWHGTALCASLAGIAGTFAVFTSYGSAAFLLIAGAALIAASSSERVTAIRAVAASGVAAVVISLLAFGIPDLLGHEPLLALRTALELHRALFTVPRGYTLWLAFNPLDFALFVGLPVAVAGLWAVGRALLRVARKTRIDRYDRFRLGLATGVLLLLLLGVTRGEVGRLWIPLMPFVLLAGIGDTGVQPTAREAVGFGALLGALTLAIASYWIV